MAVRAVMAGTTVAWSQAAQVLDIVGLIAESASTLVTFVDLTASAASSLDTEHIFLWADSSLIDGYIDLTTSAAAPLDQDSTFLWGAQSTLSINGTLLWGATQTIDTEHTLLWSAANPVDTQHVLLWGAANPVDTSILLTLDAATPVTPSITLLWGGAVFNEDGTDPNDVTHWRWRLDIVWFTEVYTGSIYPVMSSIVTADNGTNVAALSCTLETDLDSYCWSAQGTVVGDMAKNLIEPANGEIEIIITANGQQFPILVEDVSPAGAAEFGQRDLWTFKGRSPSADLGRDHQRPISYTWATNTTARQICEYLLTAAGGGWTLDWQIDDWDVPANVFTVHDVYPIQIIQRIAKSQHAFVSTSLAGRMLSVRYKFAKSPSDFVDGDKRFAVLDEDTLSESRRYEKRPGYNQVIVRGENSGYVVACTLSGSPGDNAAPVQINPLILSPQAGRHAGRGFLYDNAWDVRYRTRKHLMDAVDYPLRLPGDVVKHADWFGIVDRVAVNVSRTSVTQQVTMIEYIT
jgi:hypothetical protein